jgi:uncharacterized membrane protein YvbJ
MAYCIKCGCKIEIEGECCPECEKTLEDEVLRIKGVTKHIADTIPEKIPNQPNAEGKWSQHRFSLKNDVLLVLIIVFLGITIVLLYIYFGMLR